MPRAPAVIPGTSLSPRSSSSAVNEVVNALSRKLNGTHLDSPRPAPTPRRPSFSMDHILHPKAKDKKHAESKDDKEKRGSIALGRRPRAKEQSSSHSPRTGPVKAAKLDLIVESPPLLFIGTIDHSSGALFSGRMKLTVDDPSGKVVLNHFDMVLRATTTTKRPIGKECTNCSERHEELKRWSFLTEPRTCVKDGDNQFPFSHLLNGRLPATTHAYLGAVTYSLVATAHTSLGETIEFTRPIEVKRAIQPGPDKTSIRIFPPTNLTGRVLLPPVVHPIGTFPVQMSLSGIVERKAESQTRWRLRKMLWRVEELSKVVSLPCVKHANKVSEGKAVQMVDTRVLGQDDLKSGWKSDFDTAGGEITLEFEASIATKPTHRPSCDMHSGNGLEVKHNLVIELIVAEEFCPNRNTSLVTPTGAARVLRMQFALIVTERAGMGISWDEEQPPMYEDVPPSPPGYGKADGDGGAFAGAVMEDYHGPTIVPYDLVRVTTSNPNDPPLYRERTSLDRNDGLPMRPGRLSDEPEVVAESSRRQLTGFRLDDLEAETAEEAYRRQQRERDAAAVDQEDVGEGTAQADAPPR